MVQIKEPTTRAARAAYREERQRKKAEELAEKFHLDEHTELAKADVSAGTEELTGSRTPQIIAAEINTLKDQARQMAVVYCIEIGRRLLEAKALVAYGSWGDWLQANVDYSQSTASNFIRLFEGYGPSAGLLGGAEDLQALGKLNYTQAVALLAVPADERAAFIDEHDVENMSTRELQQAIRERDEARKHAVELEEKAGKDAEFLKDYYQAGERELLQKLEEKQAAIQQLTDDMATASAEHRKVAEQLKNAETSHASDEDVKALAEQLENSRRQVAELNEALTKAGESEAIEPTVVEVIPEETKQEIESLKAANKRLEIKLAQADQPAVKFSIHFDAIKETFRQLLGDIQEISCVDADKGQKHKNMLASLIDTMKTKV